MKLDINELHGIAMRLKIIESTMKYKHIETKPVKPESNDGLTQEAPGAWIVRSQLWLLQVFRE